MIQANINVLILGGGPAGLMCAWQAARRGRSVLILERGKRPGGKIAISGGGKCNFTNRICTEDDFVSANPAFVCSALARFGPADFLSLLEQYHIPWEEREQGRLFGTKSATHIVDMLVDLCSRQGVRFALKCDVQTVEKARDRYLVKTNQGVCRAQSLVVACGGMAYPQAGATDFGYRLAEQFYLPVITLKPGLAPLRYTKQDDELGELTGINLTAGVTHAGKTYTDQVLFTDRSLSGPAILQVSCTWQPGEAVTINWLPETDLFALLWEKKQSRGAVPVTKWLDPLLPNRMVRLWMRRYYPAVTPAKCSREQLLQFCNSLNQWQFYPAGTLGFKKAETTLGGVDTRALSSKTMAVKNAPGLYFIGEVVDVTGRLGGYNLQWAWSSGFAAGQFV